MATHPVDPITSQPQRLPTVIELLQRVAAERGLDFEPAPALVTDALPELTRHVESLAGRCDDAQEQRWLAAALAALAHHVQTTALPEVPHPGATR